MLNANNNPTNSVLKCAMLLGAFLLTAASPALAEIPAPEPVHSGNITYVTGGIGLDERNGLERVKSHYNLNISSAGSYGEYVTDATVRVRDLRGNEVLNTASGPLMYVNLPAGIYTVEVASEGETRSKRVRVPEYGSVNADFRFHAS